MRILLISASRMSRFSWHSGHVVAMHSAPFATAFSKMRSMSRCAMPGMATAWLPEQHSVLKAQSTGSAPTARRSSSMLWGSSASSKESSAFGRTMVHP